MRRRESLIDGRTTLALLSFSSFLILASLFQLAYNASDSIILGHFLGEDALAASGVSAPVNNIIILSLTGLSTGPAILTAYYYGKGDGKRLKNTYSSVLTAGLVFSLLVAAIGAVSSPFIIRWMNTPKEIEIMSTSYLRILLLGTPFAFSYNALSSTLKSMGNAKIPLFFLILSSLLNIFLDIILIGLLGFGIRASAATTIFSEFLSALLCFIYIQKREKLLALRIRDMKIDKDELSLTLSYSVSSLIQQTIQPVFKLLIQGAINTMGVSQIAAFNIASRLDDFAFTPEQNIASAETTFISQNLGAGKKDRIKKGIISGLVIEACYALLLFLILHFFSEPIIGIFISRDESAVIKEAGAYISFMSLIYILPACTNLLQGVLRGFGMVKSTITGTFIQAGARCFFTYLLVPEMGILAVAFSCMTGWLLMLLFLIPYTYYHARKRTQT